MEGETVSDFSTKAVTRLFYIVCSNIGLCHICGSLYDCMATATLLMLKDELSSETDSKKVASISVGNLRKEFCDDYFHGMDKYRRNIQWCKVPRLDMVLLWLAAILRCRWCKTSRIFDDLFLAAFCNIMTIAYNQMVVDGKVLSPSASLEKKQRRCTLYRWFCFRSRVK